MLQASIAALIRASEERTQSRFERRIEQLELSLKEAMGVPGGEVKTDGGGAPLPSPTPQRTKAPPKLSDIKKVGSQRERAVVPSSPDVETAGSEASGSSVDVVATEVLALVEGDLEVRALIKGVRKDLDGFSDRSERSETRRERTRSMSDTTEGSFKVCP